MANKMNFVILLSVAVLVVPCLAVTSNGKSYTIVRKVDCEEDVAMDLAEYMANIAEIHIKEKHSFSVVLSGGSLIHTLRKIVEPPYNSTINWSKWLIFWVDERVVPLDDPLSNYKLAQDGFLSKVPIPKHNIYPINYTTSPAAVAAGYDARLKTLAQKETLPLSPTGFPQFDLILLGIGPDGHIASLFPNRPQRYEKNRWVTFITDSPKPPPQRITLTFPVINSASYVAMVVTEKGEADAVAAALGGGGGGSPNLPCAEVKAAVELTWFLDKGAASKLNLH